MTDEGQFRRLAGVVALGGALLALGSGAFLLVALGGTRLNPSASFLAFNHPAGILAIGHEDAVLLRWGMLLDLFGYYLPVAPLALAVWSELRPRGRSLITLYTFCGLGYVLVGALGAVTLAAALPPLITAYVNASAPQREALSIVAATIVNTVYVGFWNILEATLAGIWWMGTGIALRNTHRVSGVLGILLGICWLLDALGHVVDIQAIWYVPLGAILLIYPIWAVWLGIDLLLGSPPRSHYAVATESPLD